jgi:hypothetical protein
LTNAAPVTTSIELLDTKIIPVLEKNARSIEVDGLAQPAAAEPVT